MGNKGRYISNRLRKHRLQMGYTQKQVAELLGVSDRKRISEWERGLFIPSGDCLLRLAKIYRVLPQVLYQEHLASFEKELPMKEQRMREQRKKKRKT